MHVTVFHVNKLFSISRVRSLILTLISEIKGYDEPALKANFTLHITHDPAYSTISNMPQSNQVVK